MGLGARAGIRVSLTLGLSLVLTLTLTLTLLALCAEACFSSMRQLHAQRWTPTVSSGSCGWRRARPYLVRVGIRVGVGVRVRAGVRELGSGVGLKLRGQATEGRLLTARGEVGDGGVAHEVLRARLQGLLGAGVAGVELDHIEAEALQ